jgi:hypothetical protein
VGTKLEAERAGKRRHLRRHDRIRARSGGEDDGGVVDDADLRSALHEAHRFQQEVLGLESRVSRVVLRKQPPRAGQHQARALRGHASPCDHHPVR